MSFRALSSAIGILGFAAEIFLLALLVFRRQYKVFPVFTFYFAFNFLIDLVIGITIAKYSMQAGKSLELAVLPLQYFLELCVLFEIGWHVLRPVHPSLPRGSVWVFSGAVLLAILLGALLAFRVHDTGQRVESLKRPLDLTVGLLRMLIFAVIAGFAQVLGIGWKSKVLQLATALSLYSALDLIVSLVQRQSGIVAALDPLHGVAYSVELCFLVWVFTTKELPRREFSPQMEQFLITLAARAKLARTALVRTQVK
jgi:hypothetical protein